MKQILDELVKLIIALIIVAISYKYYQITEEKNLRALEARGRQRLISQADYNGKQRIF